MTTARFVDVQTTVANCDCLVCRKFSTSFGNMQSVLNPHPLPPKPKKESDK